MILEEAINTRIIDGNRLDYLKLFDKIFIDHENTISSYKHIVEQLWQIIDDIDTASDKCKGNLEAYEKIVHKLQAKRWETEIGCDGYKLDFSKIEG